MDDVRCIVLAGQIPVMVALQCIMIVVVVDKQSHILPVITSALWLDVSWKYDDARNSCLRCLMTKAIDV